MSEWQVLLLGGSTAAGKTTSGRMLARQVGIACISADSLWNALMAVTAPETHPAFHHFEPSPEVFARGPDHLARLHIEQSEAMTAALDAFVSREIHDGNRFVFEGAWITPELAERKCGESDGVRAVFIHEPEENEILRSMLRRSGRTEPLPRQIAISGMAWRYGNWLREQTDQLGLATVEARPRESLVDRIIEAIG